MHKSILSCFVFLIVLSSQAQVTVTFDASQTEDLDKIAILDVMNMQEESWNKGDIDGFMEGYWKSDSLRFIGSRGLTYGWNNTLANYKKAYPDNAAMGKLEFEILHLDKIASDVYFMVGKYTLIRAADKPSGYFNLLWRKIDGKWVIVSDMTAAK